VAKENKKCINSKFITLKENNVKYVVLSAIVCEAFDNLTYRDIYIEVIHEYIDDCNCICNN